MPFDDDEDDEPLVVGAKSGGGEAAEYKALAEGNGEPSILGSMDHPDFPANVVWVPPGTNKHALPAWARIAWFRTNCPNWTLITEQVEVSPKVAIFRAALMRPDGTIHSSATKSWSFSKNPAFYIECAETGSVARCLEMAGFNPERCLTAEGRNHLKDFT